MTLLRSILDVDPPNARELLAERRGGLRPTAQRPTRIARFHEGRLLRGTATMHRTKQARLWRCRLRLKTLTEGARSSTLELF